MTKPPPGSAAPAQRLSLGWLAFPIVTLGLLAFVPALYIAAHFRARRYYAVAAGMAVATAVSIGLAGSSNQDSARSQIGGGLLVGLGIAGLVVVLYFRWRQTPAAAPISVVDPLAAAKQHREQRERARAIALKDPHLAVEAGIGRPDLPTHYQDGGLVDVNRASAQAIATLPGIDEALADKFVARRSEVGGYSSVADLTVTFDLLPTTLDDASDRLLFIPL